MNDCNKNDNVVCCAVVYCRNSRGVDDASMTSRVVGRDDAEEANGVSVDQSLSYEKCQRHDDVTQRLDC